MRFWKNIFQVNEEDQVAEIIYFGRFSDAYKKTQKYADWDESISLFNQEKYIEAYSLFFNYLKIDDTENLNFEINEDKISFSLFQGSKKIQGKIDKLNIRAFSLIAIGSEINIGLLRRLLEINYKLNYCKYSLNDEGYITLVFDSLLTDASPYKLYYALKELAINADKLDDLILSEFNTLDAVNDPMVIPSSDLIKSEKTFFFKKNMTELMRILDKGALNIYEYPSAASYLIFSTLYKIDFLICPQGPILEEIEKLHKYFSSNENIHLESKINKIYKDLKSLDNLDSESLKNELYKAVYTFGINPPATEKQIKQIMESELSKAQWYIQNGHLEYAAAIPSYIIGYILFNYAVDPFTFAIYKLYYQISEHDFFKKLGYELDFIDINQKLNGKQIKKHFRKTLDQLTNDYEDIELNINHLRFNNLAEFGVSFIEMLFTVQYRPISIH